MLATIERPLSIDELLQRSHPVEHSDEPTGTLIKLDAGEGYESHDVYNQSAIEEDDKGPLMMARREKRNDETHTTSPFFRPDESGTWRVDDSLPCMPWQDPFLAKIAGMWVMSGVRVVPKPNNPKAVLSFYTEMLFGENLHEPEYRVIGPPNMKDITPVDMDDRVGLFTRPMEGKAGRGKIGFIVLKSLRDITPQVLADAPIVTGLIDDERGEWGGIKNARMLPDGRIGTVGHLSRFILDEYGRETEDKEYLAHTSVVNPDNLSVSDQQIPACRDCFGEVPQKRRGLRDIFFATDLVPDGDTAILSGGLSDTSAGCVRIPNPYAEAA